jgi:MFS family permease
MDARGAAMRAADGAGVGPAPQIGVLLAAVLVVYVGQTTLNPVIAPLSREVGLAAWQVGLTISAAAATMVVASQFWGRRAARWGTKRVLVLAGASAATVMAGFTLVVWLGLMGAISQPVLLAGFLALRGLGYGFAIAAVAPAAQAYLAAVTPDEPARVRAMAAIGASQGIASLVGAIVGGSLAALGLMAALAAVPVLLAAGTILVAVKLRPASGSELIPDPPRVRPTDPRVFPYLLAGLGLFTGFGFIQVTAGFLIQDRLGLAPEAAGSATGIGLLLAGLGMVVAQAVVVPRSGWPPGRLLRTGSLVSLAGFASLLPSGGAAPLAVGMLLIGVGLGLAMPGYTAGPSLRVSPEEQGGLAGLIGATNALTFVIAPTLATLLYGVDPVAPVVVAVGVLIGVSGFVWQHPAFRQASAD